MSAIAVIDMPADTALRRHNGDGDGDGDRQSVPDSIEKVQRTDAGVSISFTIKRGTGTRDQDKLQWKGNPETVEDARADLEELKADVRSFAQDLRDIQPGRDDTERE